jgi:hypothetical protein
MHTASVLLPLQQRASEVRESSAKRPTKPWEMPGAGRQEAGLRWLVDTGENERCLELVKSTRQMFERTETALSS